MAILEPHGIPSISEQRTNHIIKSLNADLRAVRASLAAAEERVKALEAENERLTKAVEEARQNLVCIAGGFIGDYSSGQVAAIALNKISEALQAKEAE